MVRIERLFWICALVLPLLIAVANVTGRIAGANDSSRLAAIDAIADQHSLSIDNSKFRWSEDRMFVDGHFYSDKPLVPAFLLAVVAVGMKSIAHIDAESRNVAYVYVLTLSSSGLAYAISVWALLGLVRSRTSDLLASVLLVSSFALGSLAPVYVQNMNSSIVVLAAGMCVAWGMVQLREQSAKERRVGVRLPAFLGIVTGLNYAFETPSGGVLFILLIAYIAYRCEWRIRPIFAFLLASLPFIVAHHILNYVVGGTFAPANANPENFRYPGSVIDPTTITGIWSHASISSFLEYAAGLLIGPRGMIIYTPTMVLALVALIRIVARRPWTVRERDPLGDLWLEMLLLTVWMGAVWLVYAILSSDQGGTSASIRWLVPALAPTYFVLIEVLRKQPGAIRGFLILVAGQAAITLLAWRVGPLDSPPEFPIFQIGMGAIGAWLVYVLLSRARTRPES